MGVIKYLKSMVVVNLSEIIIRCYYTSKFLFKHALKYLKILKLFCLCGKSVMCQIFFFEKSF